MTAAKLSFVAIGVIAVALALARIHPFGDPQRHLHQPRETQLQAAAMPDSSLRTLLAKCGDCHSNATYWPVYSQAAPVSWLIERDVIEGRNHLNLSHWDELSADRRQVLEQEIVQQIRRGAMPPLSYRLVHWQANLGRSDRDALMQLVPAETAQATTTQPGDADRGRALFNRRCTGCHALDTDREGPHLRGVYLRRAGSVTGFEYSSAIRNSGITWTEANLNRWLSDTDSMVPGNAMGFAVPRPQERSDLIAFLRSLQ